MKTIKIIIISLAMMGLCNTTQAQYKSTGKGKYGLLMSLGGVSIMIGGFATRPERYYNNGLWIEKPFHRQGPRATAIVCGMTLTITGFITAISGN
jgi:hypothetical protein